VLLQRQEERTAQLTKVEPEQGKMKAEAGKLPTRAEGLYGSSNASKRSEPLISPGATQRKGAGDEG
jgi:hypothetical protein